MIVKLLTEHHLEFLSLKGRCRGLSESSLVKMPHCWKPHALAQMYYVSIGEIATNHKKRHVHVCTVFDCLSWNCG